MKVVAIIPARYASTRFPGKPLVLIHGKTMIRRVYEQVKKVKAIDKVFVATDDVRIYDEVNSFGGQAVYTNTDHQSGTDRCFEAYKKFGFEADLIVNVQGDEPFIQPGQIEELISLFKKDDVKVGTLIKEIGSSEELLNPNKVKCLIDLMGKALIFSRQPIPFIKDKKEKEWIKFHTYFKHIGMYAFRPKTLESLVILPVSKLEAAESLEQLRWMENGHEVHTFITSQEAMAIDTPEDLNLMLKLYTDQH